MAEGIPGAAVADNTDIAAFIRSARSTASVGPSSFTMPPPQVVTGAVPPPPASAEDAATETAVSEALALPPSDPQEDFLKQLERLKITKDTAAQIVDAMLFKGFYEEEIPLTKKVKVKFKTRGQEAVDRLNTEINRIDPKFNGTLYSLVAEYNIAASLVAYGPYQFDGSTDEGFEKTLKYIKALPTPVFQLLANKLSKFDDKTMTVMSEEATSFF